MNVASGDIVLVDLGTVPSGREQAGVRPAIVVSEEGGVSIIIPLSSNITRLRFKSTVRIAPSKTNRLSKTSVALVFQLRAVDTGRLVHRIGALSSKDRATVNKTLRFVARIS